MSKKTTTTKFTLDPAHLPRLTPAQAKRLDKAPVDHSDIPELPHGFWAAHRPAAVEPKTSVTLRLDSDVLHFFRAQGTRYQTRINAVLRTFVEAHTLPPASLSRASRHKAP